MLLFSYVTNINCLSTADDVPASAPLQNLGEPQDMGDSILAPNTSVEHNGVFSPATLMNTSSELTEPSQEIEKTRLQS